MEPLDRFLLTSIGVCLLVIAFCQAWIFVDRFRARRKLQRILHSNMPRAGSGR